MNDNINFDRQFYFKVVFPVVDCEVNENGNVQGLVSLFNKNQILQYEEYNGF